MRCDAFYSRWVRYLRGTLALFSLLLVACSSGADPESLSAKVHGLGSGLRLKLSAMPYELVFESQAAQALLRDFDSRRANVLPLIPDGVPDVPQCVTAVLRYALSAGEDVSYVEFALSEALQPKHVLARDRSYPEKLLQGERYALARAELASFTRLPALEHLWVSDELLVRATQREAELFGVVSKLLLQETAGILSLEPAATASERLSRGPAATVDFALQRVRFVNNAALESSASALSHAALWALETPLSFSSRAFGEGTRCVSGKAVCWRALQDGEAAAPVTQIQPGDADQGWVCWPGTSSGGGGRRPVLQPSVTSANRAPRAA